MKLHIKNYLKQKILKFFMYVFEVLTKNQRRSVIKEI